VSGARDDSGIELACLEVHGQFYGVDVQQVREIVRSQVVTPLPQAPGLIEGVIDLRGAIVPVVDLGRALVHRASREGPRARIAIVEVDGLVFGLRIDAAADVVAVEAGGIGEPPPLVAQAGYEAVRAVVRRAGDHPILVLSLEHLLERIFRSALGGGAAPGEAGPTPNGAETGAGRPEA
jgi:purine-binding chemotaxis protein CheW